MSTQINNNNHWSFKILLNLGTKSSKSKLKLRKGNPPKPPSLTCKNTEVQTQQLQMTALQTKSQATKNLESKQVFRQCKLFINNKIYIFQSCYLWQIDLAIKRSLIPYPVLGQIKRYLIFATMKLKVLSDANYSIYCEL